MSPRNSFYWKVGYIVALVALIYPLQWLSQPASLHAAGGKLAQLRDKYDLSEANLGEIDASAETIKLATLGLRGVAVNILWERANYYKMIEDWSGFGAALTQIANLQPHYYSVWDFQAHNLTYNTSVEFDDYHDRFYWVMEGIKFLKHGKELNKKEPRITARIGWFIGNKIGRADEHRQYRRLFKEDDAFHNVDNPNRDRSKRDNWLVSYEYYHEAQEQVRHGAPLRTTPVIFHAQPMMSLINYAEALESDSTAGETPKFGEVAQNAWSNALRELQIFAARDVPSTGIGIIHLDALEDLEAHENALERQLRKLLPGEFERQYAERKPKLNKEEKTALETAPEKRTGVRQTINIQFWTDIADRAAEAQRATARKLAAQWLRTEETARDIRISRGIVNFDYWKTRCEAEPTDAALLAREYQYKAGLEQTEARPGAAKKLYEQSFDQWRIVLDHFKILREDTLMAQDLNETIDKYRDVLRQYEAPFPKKFVLQDMLDLYEQSNPRPHPKAAPASKPPEKTTDKAAEKKPAEKSAEKSLEKSEAKTPPATKPETPPAESKKEPSDNKPANEKPANGKPSDNKPSKPDGKSSTPNPIKKPAPSPAAN
jgi:hypothetical protein